MDRSEQLFERAKRVLPGGVNSPVRAYRAVGMAPRFITRADGAYIYDEDGKRYIDYVCSWGPMILGHNHPVIREVVERAVKDGLSFGAPTRREVEIAELMIGMVPNIEMVRMVNSGTEAVMSALRLARGATGRDKLIKFEGCYHGHSDCMLVNAGSSALAGGHPSSAGVPVGAARDTLTAQFNDLASVEALLEQNPGQVAAVIVEPVAANMGVVGPAPGFLEGLRTLCDKHGALLIFDEVITGFRLAPGGAQAYFGVRADLVTFGKIIDALEGGAKGSITVAVACGVAGIISGCITVTGLASKLLSTIVSLSGGHMIIALALTMLCCIVLGMGVPTTANYCIMAATCAPILIQLGVPLVCAHFFVFYFGILADITPPVALAAYAGSAIAKSKPMKTAVTASRLGIAAYIVPFVFAFCPALIMQAPVEPYMVVLNTAMALFGLFGVASGLQGYLFGKINPILRVFAIVAGVAIMIPMSEADGIASLGINAIGFLFVFGVFAYQKLVHGKKDKGTKATA